MELTDSFIRQTWKRSKHPSEMVQHIELEVRSSIDREKGRCSWTQTETNPWRNEREIPRVLKVRGKIVNLVPYGAFIEIEPELKTHPRFRNVMGEKRH